MGLDGATWMLEGRCKDIFRAVYEAIASSLPADQEWEAV